MHGTPQASANRATAVVDGLASEAVVFALLIASASVMATGYVLDLAGVTMRPSLLAVAGLLSIALAAHAFRADSSFRAPTAIFLAVVALSTAYLLYLASPSFLPVATGPDVVHHLQLIHVIQRTHRLAHDPAQYPYLLEMMNYTPGSHVLAAAVGDWLRVDALRVIEPIVAVFVALKMGMLYLLALRVGERLRGARVAALAAPVLAFVPAAYTIGSSFQFFFFAQVVSETFAIGMLLAIVCWLQTSGRVFIVAFAACGVGVFLSWPVWLGPGLGAFAVALLFARVSWRQRARIGAAALAPIAIVVAVHVALHAEGGRILASSGAVTTPSVAAFGLGFLVCAACGVLFVPRMRAAIPVAVFLALTLLQAVALAALAMRAGTHGFYMPFKMVYLAVLPAAVLGALALMRGADRLAAHRPRVASLAAILPLALAALLLVSRVPAVPQRSPIQASAYRAGLWARAHVNPSCVDYFTTHWLTGYWLHLDVLGNPRLTDRMRNETFEFSDTVGRWILGRGLPYGIVEGIDTLPRELRPDVTVLETFGPFAVVQNRRAVMCP